MEVVKLNKFYKEVHLNQDDLGVSIFRNNNGNFQIGNLELDTNVFEDVEYKIIEKDEQIDDLIDWITESERISSKTLMKDDVKMLISWDDKYILSSLSTNEYLSYSFDEIQFVEILQSMIEKTLKIKGRNKK